MSNPKGSKGGKETYDVDLDYMRSLVARRCQPDEKGCLVWNGYCLKGYPQTNIRGKSRLVHRALYFAERGPIPEEMQIDHSCDNTKCLNIEHLRTATAKQNTLRSNNPCAQHSRRELCINGHKFDAMRVDKRGRVRRVCSICERKGKRDYKRRKRENNDRNSLQV